MLERPDKSDKIIIDSDGALYDEKAAEMSAQASQMKGIVEGLLVVVDGRGAEIRQTSRPAGKKRPDGALAQGKEMTPWST